ncbi:MAG: phosphatidylserine synthase [Methylocystis sp.]|nr:MAG: phosphatidylserine synthase [Methylocystis sp.]
MKRLVFALPFCAFAQAASADSCVIERQAYAPAANLEEIDVELLGRATRSIDMAAYVLTSVPIVEALDAAAERGVAIRLYRDGRDARMPARLAQAYNRLAARLNVEIRYKGDPQPFMHLKAYAVDGAFVRDGAGNFTHSGLRKQDNSLIALKCESAVARFSKAFEAMWVR